MLDSLKTGKIDEVYIQENLKGDKKIGEIYEYARQANAKVSWVKKHDLDRISGNGIRSQGVAAISKKTDNMSLADFLDTVENDQDVCFVVLTDMSYEQNLGAILRTLDGAGISGVIISSRIKNADSNVVRKVAMGASESINIFYQNIFNSMKMLKGKGFKIIGVEPFGKKDYFNEPLSGRIALLFGGEDKSLTEPLLNECDELIKIPMKGIVTSLNVSVSVGVIVYERLRQIDSN